MASLQAYAPPAPGSDTPQYLTLNPDSEPMRLDSLCVSCMKNVRVVKQRVFVRSPARSLLRSGRDDAAYDQDTILPRGVWLLQDQPAWASKTAKPPLRLACPAGCTDGL